MLDVYARYLVKFVQKYKEEVTVMQTESECGGGRNIWNFALPVGVQCGSI